MYRLPFLATAALLASLSAAQAQSPINGQTIVATPTSNAVVAKMTAVLSATVTSVFGLVVSPFQTAAAGAQVSVIAREPTQ